MPCGTTRRFAKLNVGVSVKDGIVVLHGQVPTMAVVEAAAAAVRKVAGVREVVNELYVPPVDGFAKPVPRAAESQRPTMPAPPPLAKAEPVKPVPVAPAPPPPTLSEQIDRLRASDRRYRDIRFEVQNGKVTLEAPSRSRWTPGSSPARRGRFPA